MKNLLLLVVVSCNPLLGFSQKTLDSIADHWQDIQMIEMKCFTQKKLECYLRDYNFEGEGFVKIRARRPIESQSDLSKKELEKIKRYLRKRHYRVFAVTEIDRNRNKHFVGWYAVGWEKSGASIR